MHRGHSSNLMVECLLCSYAAVVVGLVHSNLDSDVKSTSSLGDLCLLSRKSFVFTVLPLYCRKWITVSFTLQQRRVLWVIKCPDTWLWSCTCRLQRHSFSIVKVILWFCSSTLCLYTVYCVKSVRNDIVFLSVINVLYRQEQDVRGRGENPFWLRCQRATCGAISVWASGWPCTAI